MSGAVPRGKEKMFRRRFTGDSRRSDETRFSGALSGYNALGVEQPDGPVGRE